MGGLFAPVLAVAHLSTGAAEAASLANGFGAFFMGPLYVRAWRDRQDLLVVAAYPARFPARHDRGHMVHVGSIWVYTV
jgi:hypothetical protein